MRMDLISGVILAGGRSSRMGHQDKGLVLFKHRPMIAHIVERLQPQVSELIISANHHQEKYAQYAKRIVADDNPDFPGPMAGICAALKVIASDYLLIVPCDGPLLPMDLAARLYQGIQKSGSLLAAVHDGAFRQPTYSLLHRSLLSDAENFINQGERKLGKWLQQNRATWVDFSDQAAAFVNINSRDELQRVEESLSHTV